MRVVVTGAHGLIGSALVTALRAGGDDVVRLVRGEPEGPGDVRWDPARGELDPAALGEVDAAVNLAGAGVGDKRWTDSYKNTIMESRVSSTRTLVTALTALDRKPAVLVSGSAMGVYGDRGDEVLTETSPAGASFLADVVKQWEAAAEPAAAQGIRVVHPRTSLVMSTDGGAFAPLLLLVKLGLAGPLGGGRNWWSWITLPDMVSALKFMIDSDLTGPVNVSSPEPRPSGEVIKAIASAKHRPAILPAPAFAMRIAVGEFANEILASQRLDPVRLREAGFGYAHPTLDAAARWLATG